jgi:TonB family protein
MAGFEFLLAGRTLADRYRLEAVIGRGGMGAVFRAADLRLDRPVAVKVVATHEDDGRLRARFRREAQSAARIRHPHVVTVYDFGTDPELGLDFLVMELLEGEDLSRGVARHGALPMAQGLAMLRDTTQGLAAGHRLGLVHRDVKPGNVFLAGGGENPRFVLLDYGIAKLHAEDDDTHTALTRVGGSAPHSPGFAAPEQVRGDDQLTPACDIFSLAATAYYALSGERAFTAAQLQSLAAGEVVEITPLTDRVPGLPDEVGAAIAQALDPDPSRRPPDGDAFAALLAGLPMPDPVLVPRPMAAPPPPLEPVALPLAPADKPVRRHPWLWPMIALGSVAAAAGLLLVPTGPPVPAEVALPLVVDSTTRIDSLALAAAREDSAARARARRDSIRETLLDSITRAQQAAARDSIRAESSVVVPPPPPEDPTPAADVYDLSALTRRPELRNRREMQRIAERNYPPALHEAGVEGRVVVTMVIGVDGRPEPGSIRVAESDNPQFNEAAMRIAQSVRFRPAEVERRRVRVATSLPIDFRIRR